MLSAWRHWCRLCAREDGSAIDIFLKHENNYDIAEAINKYFAISVSPLDQAPTMICTACFQFLTTFAKFAERVSKVESMYSAIIFENTNSIDYTTLKFQYGVMDDDCPLPSAIDKCDQSTDTNDTTIEFLHIPEEMYGSDPSSDNLESDVPCSLSKIVSPSIGRIDPLVELLKIEHISAVDKESIGEVTADDYQLQDDHKTVEHSTDAENDISIDSLKESKKPRKRVKIKVELSEGTIQCDICKQVFEQKARLRYHKRVYHPSEKTSFACSKCGRKFPTEKRAKQHEMIHLDPEMKLVYPCGYCDKKFSKTANLQTHIRTIHIGERPFICESCGKSFATKGALNEHKYTHMDETPFQCSSCPKKFKNLARLKTHEDTHKGTTYVCPNCGLMLNTKRTLQMHMVVHSDQKKYKCNFCGNEFKRAKALKNHLILHSGLRPYTCPFCDKTFANGSNCRSHKKKAHPQELAAMEAAGESVHATNIPKLEQLKAVSLKGDSSSLPPETENERDIMSNDSVSVPVSMQLDNTSLGLVQHASDQLAHDTPTQYLQQNLFDQIQVPLHS